MQPITIFSEFSHHTNVTSECQNRAIHMLEEGQTLFFPELNFAIDDEEQRLLSPKFVDRKSKNISFDYSNDTLKGGHGTAEDLNAIKAMTERFFSFANKLMHTLFPHYKNTLQPARTSFRPVQISHRKTSYRKDDKRLHVDAFPSNPNQGRRILRVFTNINLNGEDRIWRLGEPFHDVASRFLPTIPGYFPSAARLLKVLKLTKNLRTQYDHIMLHIHDNMKKDSHYQQTAQQIEYRFPPGTTWIVQTDLVSHAAMSGQHLLEQTFYLPVGGMVDPNRSPLKILEKIMGTALV